MFKWSIFFGLVFLMSCETAEKEDNTNEDDEETSLEGDNSEDCQDQIDNDDDGLVDCDDQGCFNSDFCVEEESNPAMELSVTSINFPAQNVSLDEIATEVVFINNIGNADLNIDSIYVSDEAGPFTLTPLTNSRIRPQEDAQFTVIFEPQFVAPNSGTVYIESNDPNQPISEIELNGDGITDIDPRMYVTPSIYDFGSLYLGCDESQTITINNFGSTELIVSSIEWMSPSSEFSFNDNLDINSPPPWILAPNESLDVFVDYAPLDLQSDASFITIQSNDPYSPEMIVTQEGNGESYAERTDVFEHVSQATDIIFAVDRSCSMNDDIQNIQNNFSSFTNSLSAQDADYHISVAVTDAGCVYGADAYIDASFSAADASSTLTTMIDINHQNTPYANNTERAFTLLEAFLSEAVDSNGDPNPSGCNYGAIRKQATLALISVSDEPEQSVNNYAHYVSLFQAYKTDPNDVIFHAIGGDYPSGCGSASAYTGYYEATVATGGLFLSICASDWGTHLETLAEGTYSGSGGGITLSNQAVNNSVVVKVDGVTQWAGWTYNEVNNRIEFDQGYAPSNGQTVQVDYTENPCY